MRSIVAVVLAGAAAGLALPAGAQAASKGSCLRHAYGSVLLTPQVVVFQTAQATDEGLDHRYYACRKPSGPPVLLAYEAAGDDLYGSDAEVRDVRAVGSSVVAVTRTGGAGYSMCTKYMLDVEDCPTPVTTLRVADTRTLRAGAIATPASLMGYALSPAGALAWVDGGTLRATRLAPRGRHALAAAAVRDLDHGTAFTQLAFGGLHLSWLRDGVAGSADL